MIDLEQWILEYIKENHDIIATINSNFKQDLKFDSLDLVEMELALDEVYNFDTNQLNFNTIKTVSDLIQAIKAASC